MDIKYPNKNIFVKENNFIEIKMFIFATAIGSLVLSHKGIHINTILSILKIGLIFRLNVLVNIFPWRSTMCCGSSKRCCSCNTLVNHPY